MKILEVANICSTISNICSVVKMILKIKKLKKLCINKCLLSLSTLPPPHKTLSPYSPNTSTPLKNFLPSHQKTLYKNPSKLPNKYSTHTHSLPLQTTQPHTLLKIKKSHSLLLKNKKSLSHKNHTYLSLIHTSHTHHNQILQTFTPYP